MAAKKAETKKEAKVKIRLPKAGRHEPNFVFVSVNGKNYKIMKGVEVEVPRYVAEVIRESEIARNKADEFVSSVQ